MKAMILAAGRGQRMRPLTDAIPKPLLTVAGKPLLAHLIERLAGAGLRDLVINYAHLGERIVEYCGDGSRFGVRIVYSPETQGELETGGGIFHALPLIASDPFVVVNGDVWTDYAFERLPRKLDGEAHLVLVDNPEHHRQGDFFLHGQVVFDDGGGEDEPRLTFGGIGVYRHALFAGCKPGKFPLAPLLRAAMRRSAVTGELHRGGWYDIGTPDRLTALDRKLSAHARL